MPFEAGPVAPEPAPVRGRAQTYLTTVFFILGGLIPVCMFLGVRGVAPAVGLAGLFCLPLARPIRGDRLGLGLLAALVVWAAISVIWSLQPVPHLLTNAKDFQRFTALHLALQLLLSGALVFSAARLNGITAERVLLGFGVGLLAGALLLTVEMASHAAIYQAMMQAVGQPIRPDLAVRNLAQGGYIAAVLVWPVGLTLRLRGWNLAMVALAAFVPLSTALFRGDAPTIGLVLSAPVFFLVMRFGRAAVLALAALVALYILLTPWAMLGLQRVGVFAALHHHLPASWDARLDIWAFATHVFLDHPWRGLGLDASRAFPDLILLHPHNSALQLWFELGALGAALAAAFWAWLLRRVAVLARDERLFAAIASATATVYLTIGALSFGVWQEWWLCVGALALTACILVRRAVARVNDDLPWAVAKT